MGNGYIRQSLADIQTGQDITAPPLNAEFNALEAAFNNVSGHVHDGSAGNGPKIDVTASITGVIPLANGGTAAALTASNGGMLYSTASALAILAATATAHQLLVSGASGAPAWSTLTVPVTATAGTILAAGTANTVTATATPTLGIAGSTLGTITLAGNTSGSTILQPNATASGTLTLPAATDTLVGKATTDILSNKSFPSITFNGSVTGTQILQSASTTTGTMTLPSGTSNLVSESGTQSLTNKTLVAPTLSTVTLTNTINKVAITAPATLATLALVDGTTVTGPAATGTLMTLGNTETVSGLKTFSSLLTLSSGQLVFPSTQLASAGVNTLDDYEEGTFTPVWTNLTVVGSNTTSGTYTKIGRLVYIQVLAIGSTSLAGTANSTSFTLPFTLFAQTVLNMSDGGVSDRGTGLFYTGDGHAYTPSFSATGAQLIFSGTYITTT